MSSPQDRVQQYIGQLDKEVCRLFPLPIAHCILTDLRLLSLIWNNSFPNTPL